MTGPVPTPSRRPSVGQPTMHRPRRPGGECITGKRRWHTDTYALIGLVWTSLCDVDRTSVYPTRTYQCEFCDGWHLTHLTLEQYNEVTAGLHLR